jgi:hypothetical protein
MNLPERADSIPEGELDYNKIPWNPRKPEIPKNTDHTTLWKSEPYEPHEKPKSTKHPKTTKHTKPRNTRKPRNNELHGFPEIRTTENTEIPKTVGWRSTGSTKLRNTQKPRNDELHEFPEIRTTQNTEIPKTAGWRSTPEHTGFPRSRCSLPSLRHPERERRRFRPPNRQHFVPLKKKPADLLQTSRVYRPSQKVVTTSHITPFSMLSHRPT